MTIMLIAAIAACVSWGITYIVRLSLLKHHEKTWFNILLRTISIITGGLFGLLVMYTVVGFGIGLAAGVLNTTIVAAVKHRIRKTSNE